MCICDVYMYIYITYLFINLFIYIEMVCVVRLPVGVLISKDHHLLQLATWLQCAAGVTGPFESAPV